MPIVRQNRLEHILKDLLLWGFADVSHRDGPGASQLPPGMISPKYSDTSSHTIRE